MTWRTCWLFPKTECRGACVSYSLYLSAKEHLFSVLTGPPNNAIDLFSDTDCISGRRTLKQPKLEPRRCGLCAMINAPLSQSLTSTRATPPVWYTSSQIESSALFSCLWCNHTWYRHCSQDTYPLFISSNKVLCASWLQQQLPKMRLAVLRSTRVFISAVPRRGRNDQSLCATGIAQFTAPPSALAHHSAWRWAYHCSDQLYDPVRRIRLPFCTSGLPNK